MNANIITDSLTMLRRSLRRLRRYPSLTFFIVALPVVLLLLFVYVFGGTMGAGLGLPGTPGSSLGHGAIGREAYIAYVVPGILLMTVAGTGQGTAISIAMDMTAGIIARFRTMSIARASVLAGHVIGALIQTAIATVLVLVVAAVIGFRPTADPVAWVGGAGRPARPDGCRRKLAVRRPRDVQRKRRDRQQHADDPHLAPLPELGICPAGVVA
jgi:ABC-2 type transport system permease protein